MDERDLLRKQVEVVRRSVVRICFKWQNPAKKRGKLTAVLCGVVVSIKDDGSCLVLADPAFFLREDCSFVVNLPIPGGYDAVPVVPSTKVLGPDFCGLVLQVGANDYVQPVTFETGGVRDPDRVQVFYFPNRDFFMPAAYARGYIKRGDDEHKFQFDVAFNEYGHLGAPIFNSSGHLVGISYKEGDAWSVSFLQWAVFSRAEIRSLLGTVSYVLKGNPIPAEGPVLPDGAVPPNLVQPDMAPHQQMENI